MARTLLFLSLFLFINSCCAQPTPSNDECADAEPIIKPGSFVVGTRLDYFLVVADTMPLPNPAPFKFYFQLTNGDACVDAVEIFSGTPEYNILYNEAQDSIPRG